MSVPLKRLVFIGLLLPATLHSQQPGMTRALDLERRGDYAAAVAAYQDVLRARPADIAALLGLERSLLPLNRSSEILPAIRRALPAARESSALYGIALRAWAAAGQPDSVRHIAEQWARVAPTEETPYREWGAAELGQQNRSGARAAYLEGRARLNRSDALAAELAQLELADGDYAGAVREWLLAIRRLPGYRLTAVATLGQAPVQVRPELLGILGEHTDFPARRLEAELRARWADPAGALGVLMPALPDDRIQSIAALRSLLDQVRALPTREGKLVQGRLLEALAHRSPEVQAGRLRLEAARAYAAAGDQSGARRMLGGLTDRTAGPGSTSSEAAVTLVSVLIDEGKLEEAEKRLHQLRQTVSSDQQEDLLRRLVVAWIRAGQLQRAEAMVAADSGVEGLALSGRIRLYQGDIKGAVERFRAAGPYTEDRTEATRRTALLALLQPLEVDTHPALGRALLQLERGDTTQSAAALEQLASEFPAQHGGAELNLLAGRLHAASGNLANAERLFRAAAVPEASSTAPAAELALAELLLTSGRPTQAVEVLEHLILTYPQSALVPQARRRLDEARGAVPQT
ncbi:MAG TPA: tetratricopeptide repeat protein [Gemmatimonadales bacterium]|jgi:tetratricopeptide (TPR) repeat protein|nr:tetratricopeptide repeat protein [Gemmatimonadales bacterium]